jgi:hypothetical protein
MFEGIAAHEQRRKRAKEIYDKFIFADRLAMSSTMPEEIAQMLSDALRESEAPTSVFSAVKRHLYQHLNEKYMDGFSKSQEYVRFCQWKYLELLTPYLISLHDFSIHRIIGRGGFGEVYGCRKDDSGKMLAMKLLDKKRIKVKKGEYLAVNERNMLAKVNSPFVVNLYYAFQTPEKLCFILDLMNGDLKVTSTICHTNISLCQERLPSTHVQCFVCGCPIDWNRHRDIHIIWRCFLHITGNTIALIWQGFILTSYGLFSFQAVHGH